MMLTFTRNVMTICSLATFCAAVAGCSSSSGFQTQLDGLTRSPQAPVYAKGDHDTLPGLVQEGESIFSPLTAAIHLDAGGDDAGVSQPEPGVAYLKSIAGDGAGGFRVTYAVDNQEIPVHFTADTRGQDSRYPGITHYFLVRTAAGTFRYLWPWTQTVDGKPEFDYLDLYGWSIGWPENEFTGYSTSGLRTPARNLPLGNVVYEGRMRAELRDANEPRWHGQQSLVGSLHLAANLDDRHMEGRIDNLLLGPVLGDAASHEPLADENWIDISGAIFDEGGFTADWVGHGPEWEAPQQDPAYQETMQGFAGTVIGEFYGPAGEEIGGVLSGRRGATDTAPEQFLIGGFGASREHDAAGAETERAIGPQLGMRW